MIVLGIETSTMQGGVALLEEEGLIAEAFLSVEATHSERLLPSIDRLLHDARLRLKEVDGIASAIGPGSFTGLRIGLSTAKGLALATGKPLVGVPTLEAMAFGLPFCHYQICPFLNAKKKEVYCALFRYEGETLVRVMEDSVLPLEALMERINEPTVFLGDALKAYGEALKKNLEDLALFPPRSRRAGSAAGVAELGLQRLLRGERDDPALLVPRYIRPSEAELRRKVRMKSEG